MDRSLGGAYSPDLIAIIAGYLFLSHGQTVAVLFSFSQGFVIDLFSGGMKGLFSLLYLALCGLIFLGCRLFNLQDPKGQFIIIGSAVLLKEILFIAFLYLLSTSTVPGSSFVFPSLVSALIAGLLSPVLFYLFDNLRAKSRREGTDASID